MPVIMTAAQFKTELAKSGAIVISVSDKIIKEKVIVEIPITGIGGEIKDCVFEESVIFSDIDIACGIKFINCTFKKDLRIMGCTARKYNPIFNSIQSNIVIENTHIKKLIFEGGMISRGVKIRAKSEIASLSIENLVIESSGFNISESVISDALKINKVKFNGGVSIGNSTIEGLVRVSNLEVDSISLIDSEFKSDFQIWNGTVGRLIFNNGVFNDIVKIEGLSVWDSMSVIGVEYKKEFLIKLEDSNNKTVRGSIKDVYISGCKIKEHIVFNGLGNSERAISKLTISTSKQLEGAIKFVSCNIVRIELEGENYSSNISFSYCMFNQLYIHDFYNYAVLSMATFLVWSDLVLDSPSMDINNSNLGKMHFFNVSFEKLKEVQISNSIMTDIVLINVKWFDFKLLNNAFVEFDSKNLEDSHIQKREVYRQIKYALEKQGNKIDSLMFKALEMGEYKLELAVKVRGTKANRLNFYVNTIKRIVYKCMAPIIFMVKSLLKLLPSADEFILRNEK